MSRVLPARLARINTQFWLILSLLVVSALFNAGIAPHHVVIGLYLFPTLFAAHVGGRLYAPLEAKAVITKGSGTDFDPEVVAGFLAAFETEGLELTSALVDS